MRAVLAAVMAMLAAPPSVAQPPAILPLREQAAIIDATLATRLDAIVPRLMRQQQVDMWVLVAREYLEDPVVSTMLDARSMRARRRTILIFFDPGGGRPVERLTVSRYGLGGLFAPVWEPAKEPDQWKRFARIVADRNPRRIAVNVSPLTAFGDGLTHSQHRELIAALSPALRERVVESEALAVGWLETRSAPELELGPASSASPTGSSPRACPPRSCSPARPPRRTSSGGCANAFAPSASTPGSTPPSRSSARGRRAS